MNLSNTLLARNLVQKLVVSTTSTYYACSKYGVHLMFTNKSGQENGVRLFIETGSIKGVTVYGANQGHTER